MTHHNPSCRLCPLWETAKNVCLDGSGPLDSTLLVVGTAPGWTEDKDGAAHTGEAAQLLRGVLADNGLTPRMTYAVRCRPPANREPHAEEQHACDPYLKAEIAAMPNLKYIVALGTFPMKALGVRGSVKDLAGVPVQIGSLTVIPVPSPSAITMRMTQLSTWESLWHQIRNLVNPPETSFVDTIGAVVLVNGLEGKDWRTL